MADLDLAMSINLAPSLVEQLGKALIELEAHKDDAEDTVSFSEISEHFLGLEERLRKKYLELEAREAAFKQEESDGRSLLAAKEEAVAAKEQDMHDRIQELKDAAVAAIAETRANHATPSLDSYDVLDSTENKVKCSPGTDPKEEFLHKTGKNNNGGAGEIKPHPELTQFCEQMDTRGLLSFIMENRTNITALSKKLSLALESSTEPSLLVLDSLEGFYPPDETVQEGNDKKDTAALQAMRQSCLNLLEAMATMLARAGSRADNLLNPEFKQRAKAIANGWRLKLANRGIVDAANGKSLEAQAFLQLLATFRVASEFDEEELCKLLVAVAEQRKAIELCRSLGLTHKMPGVIEELISRGILISAVHFVHAFKLTERFPTVPLLRSYLKDLRRNSQGKGSNAANSDRIQNDGNTQELLALRAVIHCVKKYHLEADYPLDPLLRRVTQLERPKTNNRKRYSDSATKHQHHKKPRAGGGGGSYDHLRHSPAASRRQDPPPVYVDRGAYAGLSERYSQASLRDPYNYQPAAPSQSTSYTHHGYDQTSHYYPQDAAAPPPTYGGYMGSGSQTSYQPYM